MDDVKFNIIGLDSLLKKLDSVTYDMKRKGGRSALRKAAKVVMTSAQQGAARLDNPETGRKIADNIAIRWGSKRFKQTGDLSFRVGVKYGAKTQDGGDTSANAPTPHWRLLELGTSKMKAQPFMRPALQNNIGKATDTFIREYEKAIDRAIKRAAKGK